jgi:hypothetical protein
MGTFIKFTDLKRHRSLWRQKTPWQKHWILLEQAAHAYNSFLLGRHVTTSVTVPFLFCVGCFQTRISQTICLGLALNLDLSDLCLLSTRITSTKCLSPLLFLYLFFLLRLPCLWLVLTFLLSWLCRKNKPRLKLSFSYYTTQIISDTWCVGVSLHIPTSKQAILNDRHVL